MFIDHLYTSYIAQQSLSYVWVILPFDNVDGMQIFCP